MNEENRCQCSFTTRQEPAGRSASRPAGFYAPITPRAGRAEGYRFGTHPAKHSGDRSASSLALLLFCLLSLSLLFALAASRSEAAAVTASAYRTAMNSGGDESSSGKADDEDLGKLKLVSLPGMLTVFAPSDSPIMPLPMSGSSVEGDLTAKVYAPAGTEVVSVLDGTVKSVTAGGAEGGVVTVSHSGGIEITFYGLRDIRVERGQPVLQRSVLGYTAGDVLRIRITKNGRPVDPSEFFGAAAGLS